MITARLFQKLYLVHFAYFVPYNDGIMLQSLSLKRGKFSFVANM